MSFAPSSVSLSLSKPNVTLPPTSPPSVLRLFSQPRVVGLKPSDCSAAWRALMTGVYFIARYVH